MFRYRIIVEWSDEDDAFLARVPALPGCVAHGRTAQRATLAAERAAEAMLEVLREDGDSAPAEDSTVDYSGQLRLRLPKSLHARLTQTASAEHVSLNALLVSLLSAGATQLRTIQKSEDADSSSEEVPKDRPRSKRRGGNRPTAA
jgi:antitoxin HicB